VGQAVAEHIVAARGDRPFADLADFATRVDPRIINRRTLETLVNAGAFDCIVPRREQGFAAIDMIVATAQRTASDQSDGIIDMFASDTPEPIRLTQNFQPWSLAEKLDRERSAIGFHISAHPLDDYAGLFKSLGVWPYARFEAEVREMGGSTPMFVIGLSDQSGSYEVIGFSEQVQQFGSLLQVGANVVIGVEGEERPDGVSLRIVSAVSLDDAASRVGRHLEIETSSERCLAAIKAQLRPGGNGRVKFVVSREEGRRLIEVDIGDGWQLSPALAGGIKALDGVVDVRLN
jgi:DNA polymerase-3 subunit alpha